MQQTPTDPKANVLQKDSLTGVLLWLLRIFSEQLFSSFFGSDDVQRLSIQQPSAGG